MRIEQLRDHMTYSAWASNRLTEAAASLPADELTRDFQTAGKSVLGTLVHVFAADRIWLQRVLGNVVNTFVSDEDYRLEALQNEWPKIYDGWQNLLMGQDDASAGRVINYSDLKGNPHRTPLWQIVLHVVNHGTHHRGQAAGFIRSMGHTPPQLDLIAYYRQK
jgi:uncharacterized damage-inducible protein DinB